MDISTRVPFLFALIELQIAIVRSVAASYLGVAHVQSSYAQPIADVFGLALSHVVKMLYSGECMIVQDTDPNRVALATGSDDASRLLSEAEVLWLRSFHYALSIDLYRSEVSHF